MEKGWTGSFYPEEEKTLMDKGPYPRHTKILKNVGQRLYKMKLMRTRPLTHESWDSFLESLSTEEFDELEKLLTEMRSESGLGQKEVGKQVETFLREDFSPDRFTRAIETLNRYGPMDGLRRLAEEDSEIAAYLRTLPQLKTNRFAKSGEANTMTYKCNTFTQFTMLIFLGVSIFFGCTDTPDDMTLTPKETSITTVPVKSVDDFQKETFSELKIEFGRNLLDDNFRILRSLTHSEAYLGYLERAFPTDEPFQTFDEFISMTPPPR